MYIGIFLFGFFDELIVGWVGSEDKVYQLDNDSR
jgi:hypothetical protein